MKLLNSIKSNSIFSTGLPALYAIAFLSGISLGLFNPFISTLMAQHKVDDILIGANSTFYYLVIALVTPIVAKVMRRLGLRKTIIFGLGLMGLFAPLFPMTTEIYLWFLIRAVMGIACCLYLVSGQTALNYFCDESNRAIVNGVNALALTFGFGIGPVIGSNFYTISPQLSFSLGSTIVLSGIIVVYFGLPEKVITAQGASQTKMFKRLRLPLLNAFAYGLGESTLVALYPVYLLRLGYTVDRIGSTFAVFVVGGLLSTIPITYIADKFGRLQTLLTSTCLVVVSYSVLSLSHNTIAINIFAFIAGASIAPILPLAMALIGEKLHRDELSAGSVLLTSTYSFGCTAGPIFSSLVMQTLGNSYIFSFVVASFAICSLCTMQKVIYMNKRFQINRLSPIDKKRHE